MGSTQAGEMLPQWDEALRRAASDLSSRVLLSQELKLEQPHGRGSWVKIGFGDRWKAEC